MKDKWDKLVDRYVPKISKMKCEWESLGGGLPDVKYNFFNCMLEFFIILGGNEKTI